MSDSGNNRVLVVERETGSVLHVVGSGDRGRQDGDFNTSTFNNPQGIKGLNCEGIKYLPF